MHQARLLMEQEGGGTGVGMQVGTAPEGLLEAAAALWGATVRRVHISEFHADVAAQLRAMGIPCALRCNLDLAVLYDFGLPLWAPNGTQHISHSATQLDRAAH